MVTTSKTGIVGHTYISLKVTHIWFRLPTSKTGVAGHTYTPRAYFKDRGSRSRVYTAKHRRVIGRGLKGFTGFSDSTNGIPFTPYRIHVRNGVVPGCKGRVAAPVGAWVPVASESNRLYDGVGGRAGEGDRLSLGSLEYVSLDHEV